LKIPYQHPAHQKIVSLVRNCKKLSYEYMNQRHRAWNKAEKMDRAFIDVTETDKKGKRMNPFERQVYIPMSRAILDTLVTYWMSVMFGKRPFFKITGRGPEDQAPAKKMEIIIDYQMERQRSLLTGYSMLRDIGKYGLANVKNIFTRKYRNAFVNQPQMSQFPFPQMTNQRVMKTVVDYEGPELTNSDIYKYFPDPRKPMGKTSLGQFEGWEYTRSWYELKKLESQGIYHNLENVQRSEGNLEQSSETDISGDTDNRNTIQGISTASMSNVDEKNPTFTLREFYIEIIPADYGLDNMEGFSESPNMPQIWVFVTINDRVVIRAEKMAYAHGKFPSNTAEFDYDGQSLFNQSFYESVEGLQDLMNWLYNSRMANVRAWLMNRAIIDPSAVNERDLIKPNPAGLIRLKKSLWEKGISIDSVFSQLKVGDVTTSHIKDADAIGDIMQRRHHTPDSLQGVETQVKRTATELAQMHTAGANHLQVQAQVIYAQAFVQMAEMMVMNNQQFLSEERYYRILGDYNKKLIAPDPMYPGGNAIRVSPDEILGYFDFPIDDGTMPIRPQENADIWREVFQAVGTNPILQQTFDSVWIFRQLCESLNVKNIDDAIIQQASPTPLNFNVMPDEQIAQQAQAGNVIPINALGR
jgi:hypothetical protein